LSCWFKFKDTYQNTAQDALLLTVGATGNPKRFLRIQRSTSGNVFVSFGCVNNFGTGSIAQILVSADTLSSSFFHMCGTHTGSTVANAGILYFNNQTDGTGSTFGTSTGYTLLEIGGNTFDGVPNSLFSGLLAEPAVWNVVLTATEVAMLAQGISPLKVRPSGLVFYAPLIGNREQEIDIVGGRILTLTP
jgi:hypothetical protein